MICVDRVTGDERVNLAKVMTFNEAARIVEEDRLIRNTVSVPVQEYEGTVFERKFSPAPEGCIYDIYKEESR